MSKRVRITNLSRRMVVFNLPHALVPEHATMRPVGVRTAEFVGTRKSAAETPGAGVRTLVGRIKPLSGSITLLAKGTAGGGDVIDNLPLSVRQVPEIVKASIARPKPEIRIEVYEVPDEAPGAVDVTHPVGAAPTSTESAPTEASPSPAEEGSPAAAHPAETPEEHPPASTPAHADPAHAAAGKTE